jgi:hypothetical protein
MVKGGGYEATRTMTNTTILISIDMVHLFGCGETSTMAGRAVVNNTDVIEYCGLKSRSLVTVNAITVGWYVIISFSSCGRSIVAGYAIIGDALVLKIGIRKNSWRVANRAIVSGCDVSWTYLCTFTRSDDTIVAGCTIISDTGMIENGRRKGARYMANFAVINRWYMIGFGVFSGCNYTVVTGITSTI